MYAGNLANLYYEYDRLKKGDKFLKKVYYNKILITYSLIIFILTLLFFSFHTVTLQSKHIEKVEEQNSALFSTYIDEQEELLTMLVDMSGYIKLVDSLGSFAFSSRKNYYSQLTALFEEVSRINSGSRSWQCDYVIHKLNDDTCVTNVSTGPLRYSLKNLGISEEEYKKIVSAFTLSDLNNRHFVFTDNRIIYISTKSFGNNQIVIAVSINNPDAAYKQYGDSSFAGVWFKDEHVTDLRTNSTLLNGMPSDNMHTEIGDGEQNFEKNGWHYSLAESDIIDSTYYFADYRIPFDRSLVGELIKVIPFLLVGFALSFAAIILVSRRLYSPIDRLLNTFMEMGADDSPTNESKNEIDYLLRQVSKIRHKNQDLVSMIEENESLSRNRLLYDLLNGDYKESTVLKELEHFGYEWLNEHNYVVTYEIQEDWLNRNIGELEQIYDKINKILLDEVKKEFQSQAVSDISQKHYFIVCCEEGKMLHQTLNKISALLDTAFSIPVILFVGKASDRYSTLQHSYITLSQMREEYKSLTVKSIYEYSDFGKIANKTALYPISIESKLLTAIENGNQVEMLKLLDYIFEEYVQNNFNNKHTKNTLVFAFANTINRAIQKSGVPREQIFEDENYFFIEMKMSTTQEELRQYILSILKKLIEQSVQIGVYKSENMKEDIIAFVKENIHKDISLICMADYFKLSPNYMSSIFKTVMNDNFKDYISRCRFELATELIRSTSGITLSELADQVGINSVTTLIRLFKKHAGCAPGQYVKSFTKD